jgi:hypothetical protein
MPPLVQERGRTPFAPFRTVLEWVAQMLVDLNARVNLRL